MPSGRGAPLRTATSIVRDTSGHDGLTPGSIMQVQRGRMLSAMVHAACEQGAANVSVADVVGRSGVSRRTFYEVFQGSGDCLSAAIEEALERAAERVLPAYEAQGEWRARVRAGLVALLGFFDEQPQIARLLVVEWLAAGQQALQRRGAVLELIAAAIDEGRAKHPKLDADLPPLTAEALVGSILSVLHRRLTQSKPDGRLLELTNPLMSMIVLPYFGTAAARRERLRPQPEIDRIGASPSETKDSAPEDLLKSLNMRLTYRTMLVLAAIAANPGGSNRVVARAAGIDDQGQISKLLMRLRKLGLVENRGAPVKGEANAWFLSATGVRVERLLRN